MAFVLLVGNAANADTGASLLPQAIAPQTGSVVVPSIPVTQSIELVVPRPEVNFEIRPQANPNYASIDPNSDTVGDLAIDEFRCDCPPCRMAVVQMLQTGQLSL
jgi:hypothetical protein